MRLALVLALASGLCAAALAAPSAHALPAQPAGLAATPAADIDIGFGIGVGTCAPVYGPYRVGYCTPSHCAPLCRPLGWWRPVTYVACVPTYGAYGAQVGYSGRPVYTHVATTCAPASVAPVLAPAYVTPPAYPAYVVPGPTVTYGTYGTYGYVPTYYAPYGTAYPYGAVYGTTTYSVGSRSWLGLSVGWSSGVRTYPAPYAYPYGYPYYRTPYAYPYGSPRYVPSPRYPSTSRGGAVHTPGRRR